MNAITRRAVSALAGLVLAAPVFVAATPVSAAPSGPVEYAALGDSYASGYGVPPYLNACGQSDSAYAVQLNGRMRINLDDFAACAGATTTSLVSGGQLAGLNSQTDLVTITIGGNDIGWGNAVGACLFYSDPVCAYYTEVSLSLIENQLPGLLNTVYTDVEQAAPNAHVVVVGYPRIFSPEFGDYLGASVAEQQTLNDGADQLNEVIATAAAEHGFQFVDVTQRFVGHGVDSPDAWINDPFNPAGALHPNFNGYKAYTAAVTSQIIPARLR